MIRQQRLHFRDFMNSACPPRTHALLNYGHRSGLPNNRKRCPSEALFFIPNLALISREVVVAFAVERDESLELNKEPIIYFLFPCGSAALPPRLVTVRARQQHGQFVFFPCSTLLSILRFV